MPDPGATGALGLRSLAGWCGGARLGLVCHMPTFMTGFLASTEGMLSIWFSMMCRAVSSGSHEACSDPPRIPAIRSHISSRGALYPLRLRLALILALIDLKLEYDVFTTS
eukprot:CAMPEP_0182882562 /NCGR_PEP_ID=MMETSP0034_2-20130328/17858_1 /TAXON_ID=156128 /ORGANISM="Nephroselmis pyriformis, Strain CCMP717" /LENGTH=109 /DNA_ID=CAMNT_0025015663 /DNA_START=153 /DNA_END=482 /DNA_ORIENTATION=-